MYTLRLNDDTPTVATILLDSIADFQNHVGTMTAFFSESESRFFQIELLDSDGMLLEITIRNFVGFDDLIKRIGIFNPKLFPDAGKPKT